MDVRNKEANNSTEFCLSVQNRFLLYNKRKKKQMKTNIQYKEGRKEGGLSMTEKDRVRKSMQIIMTDASGNAGEVGYGDNFRFVWSEYFLRCFVQC